MAHEPSLAPEAGIGDSSSAGMVRIRLVGLAVAIPCWAMLLTAWSLQPRTVGYGTAKQLGLPGCRVLTVSGYPCPTCGMTTSVAAAVRARPLEAWKAHPFGPILTAAVMLLAVTCTMQFATGWDILRRLRPSWLWALAAVIGVLAGWAWLLKAGVAEGKWPIG